MKKFVVGFALVLSCHSLSAIEPGTVGAVIGAVKLAWGFLVTHGDEIVEYNSQVKEVDLNKANYFSDAARNLTAQEAATLEWESKTCEGFEVHFDPAGSLGFSPIKIGFSFRYHWNTRRKAVRLQLLEFKKISGWVPGSKYYPTLEDANYNSNGNHVASLRFEVVKDAHDLIDWAVGDTRRGFLVDFFSDGRTEISGSENEFVKKTGQVESVEESQMVVIGTCK